MEYKVTKFSKISNILFVTFSIFLITFVWIEYYTHSIKKAITLSPIITIGFILISYPILKYFRSKSLVKSNHIKDKDQLKLNLLMGKSDVVNDYLLKIFNLILKQKLSSNLFILEDNSLVLFYFEKPQFEQDTLNEILRNYLQNKITIFCLSYEQLVYPSNTQINLINLDKISTQISSSSLKFPINIELKSKPKFSLKDMFCIILKKDKSSKYLYASMLLIFTSLITPYSIYYIAFSTMLLLLSIYSRFNTKFN